MREGRGKNQFLYNGKELVEGFDLGWYDYGARYYAPDLGRWQSTDNFADVYVNLSPYNYVANNPVILIDPDGNVIYDSQGNEITIEFDEDENIKSINGTKDQNLIELIKATYSDSEVGKETILTLNQEDVSFQINLSDKGAIWESPDGGFGIVDGLSSPGYGYDVQIDIFRNDTENTSEVSEENFDSFIVYDSYGDEKKTGNKKKQKIMESIKSGEAEESHINHQQSIGNLSPESLSNYKDASKEDKSNPSLRSRNTLIYETANSIKNWGPEGETAGKIAVGEAHKQRKK